ncbi:MAG TPA: 2-C-methyl-D-erythritol 4-phosphate cytidylyltransferase [Vicinamibacterales bacterium]|nr:2-C-methyl-D-erythritol 4-phosphate cytidylyltransferase [Vicinamibacterales bacterium]
MSIGAIIVAAGRGDRMGAPAPKQFVDLGGRSILQRSVAVFDAHAAIEQLVVVLPADAVASGAALVGPTSRACAFVAGGARRQDSVAAGVAALRPDIDVVLVHDAARPFADAALIDRVVEGAIRVGAAVPAVAVSDTVKRIDQQTGLVAGTVEREALRLAQTPQGFRRQVLEAAIALGSTGISATDEAMLAERAGHPIALVEGDPQNVKITTPHDLAVARARYQAPSRVGTGYDLHRLVAGRPLVLAGVAVPFDRGPDGHSDGDVVCHALIDAMCGAAALGDIGRHFPNNDPMWKDAAGLDLLARAVVLVREAGWAVASADVTVILERPKLAPHVDEIRSRMAGVLGLPLTAVSVKGKTNEGVDAVGRGEAIAAHAVAVVVPGPREAR